MGALSPETRNKQVAMFQSGEVDYIVATDAIGMGLNLDLDHVAFASLCKFDGRRKRRLTPSEMAQIAGRAGRHQRDGTFGTLWGMGKGDAEPLAFTDEEVYAIEEHRFAPLGFRSMPAWGRADHRAAFFAFRRSGQAILASAAPPTRRSTWCWKRGPDRGASASQACAPRWRRRRGS